MAPGCLPELGDTLTWLIQEARSATKGTSGPGPAVGTVCWLAFVEEGPQNHGRISRISEFSFLCLPGHRQQPGLIF